MTDLELLEYLFNDKKNYSFNELYKYAKMAHPKITQKIVKNFFINQQSIQMNNKKVGEKTFKPIYCETNYSSQIDLTLFPRYKNRITDMMFYLQLLILILVLHMLIIVKIKVQIIY